MSGSTALRLPEGPWRTLRALPRPVIVLIVGLAVNRMGNFLSVFLILYLTHLGYSPGRAGMVLTAFGIGSIAGVYLGGRASDQFRPRRVIVTSMLMSGVAVGAVPLVQGYPALLGTCALAGAVTQCYRPAASAMVAELTPPDRLVTATAATRLGLNIGATAGPLIGAWVALYSYPAIFIIDALTCVAFGLVAFFLLPEHPRGGSAPVRHGVPATPVGPAATTARAWLLRDRRYLGVLVATFAVAAVEVQYQAILPLQLTADGSSIQWYGGIVALNGAMVILLELPSTRFVQRLPMRLAIAGGNLLIGVGMAMFGLAGPAALLLLAVVVWTTGEILSGPSVNAYPALAAPDGLRGRYIGALTACQTAGFALGPVIGTTLFEAFGSGAWWLCAALGVVACGGTWFGVRSGAALTAARAAGPDAAPGLEVLAEPDDQAPPRT